MRRTIALTGILLPLLVVLVRSYTSHPFIAQADYALLQTLHLSAETTIIIATVLLAAILVLFALLTRKEHEPIESVLVFILSPAVLTAISAPTIGILIALFTILIMYFWRNTVTRTALSVALAFIHPAALIITVMVSITQFIQRRMLQGSIIVAASITAFFTTLRTPTIHSGFIELGIIGTPSLFIILLATAGIFITWTRERYPYLLAAAPVLIAQLFIAELALTATLLAAGIAGAAIHQLRVQEWKLESIRNITLFLILLGVVFATATTFTQVTRSSPTENFDTTINILQQISKEGYVYAPTTHNELFTWHGVRVTSQNHAHIERTRRSEQMQTLLPRYIVLHKDDQLTNLRFLIRNTNNFKTVYEGEYTIWEVRRTVPR